MLKRLLGLQQVRFLIAGCGNTALDFALLNTLVLVLGLDILLANTISVSIGITVSYFLNHHFVFRYGSRIRLVKFLEFVAITGFSSLVLQNLIIFGFELLFDTRFGNSLLFLPTAEGNHILAINVAKAFAVFIGLIWNYTLYRFVVFRRVPSPVESLPSVER